MWTKRQFWNSYFNSLRATNETPSAMTKHRRADKSKTEAVHGGQCFYEYALYVFRSLKKQVASLLN